MQVKLRNGNSCCCCCCFDLLLILRTLWNCQPSRTFNNVMGLHKLYLLIPLLDVRLDSCICWVGFFFVIRLSSIEFIYCLVFLQMPTVFDHFQINFFLFHHHHHYHHIKHTHNWIRQLMYDDHSSSSGNNNISTI